MAGSQGLGSHQERTGWPSLTQQGPRGGAAHRAGVWRPREGPALPKVTQELGRRPGRGTEAGPGCLNLLLLVTEETQLAIYRELENRGPGVEVLPKVNRATGQTGQVCARDTLRSLPPSRGLRREAETWRGAWGPEWQEDSSRAQPSLMPRVGQRRR